MRSRSEGGPGAERATRPARGRAVLLIIAASGLGVSCGDSGTDPAADRYALRVLDGDDQTGLVGSPLPRPLRVEVSELATGLPVAGAVVEWSHAGGSGARLAESATSTDQTGVAAVTLTLGLAEGEYRVIARVDGASRSAAFRAVAAALPTLDPVEEVVIAGDELTLSGSGFVPDPAAHVVTFSGVRASVTSVGPDGLGVRVPACLPTRTVTVVASVEGRASNAVPVAVSAVGSPTRLAPGEDLLISDSELLRCRRLGLMPAEAYLIAVQTVATGTAGSHAYELLGLAPTGDPGTAGGLGTGRPASLRAAASPGSHHRPRDAHAFVRRLEATAARAPRRGPTVVTSPVGRGSSGRTVQRALVRPPELGDSAVFQVLTADGGVQHVTGRLRVLSGRAELYVDVTAPSPGLSDADLQALSAEFDSIGYPTVERAFGTPSDLDANGRVTLLFTPAVNRLSPRGSGTFAGGFFYAGDLQPQDGSSGAERIYLAVPDVDGDHSDAVDPAFLLAALPAVIVHELQHMVHFAERVLAGGAERPEALWLQEALAQMAEDLVAEALDAAGEPGRAALLRAGNIERAQRFLADVAGVSLTATSGVGTLAERGAGWLFTRYLYAHLGGDQLLKRLVKSTLLGAESVVAATGEPWPRTYSDWSVTLYLDGLHPSLPARFGYPAMDLRGLLEGVNDGYRLQPEQLEPQSFLRAGVIRSASSAFVVLAPDREGEIAVTLAPGEGTESAVSGLQARLVRFR